MAVVGAVQVPAAGRAVPRARARHRADLGVPSGVQLGGAGDLDGGAPPAVPLAGHEHQAVAVAVLVTATRCTVPGARARHRGDPGLRGVQAGGAQHVDGGGPPGVPLVRHERLLTPLVAVDPAGHAVPCAIAPHGIDPGTHCADGAGDHGSRTPPAVPLAEHEQMSMALAVGVEATGRAVPGARARHRGVPDLLGGQAGGAGDLDGGAPPAVPLARHEHLAMAVAVCIAAADRAVPGARARHRADPGVPAGVEAGRAGDLDSGAPPAVPLADDVRLAVTVAVPVRAAYRAVPSARA